MRWWNDRRLGISGSVLDWRRVIDWLIVVVTVHSHQPKEAKAMLKGKAGGGNHLPSNHAIVGGVSLERVN